MKIEIIRKCLIGGHPLPVNVGHVVEAEDTEAKALIAVGIAKATEKDITLQVSPPQDAPIRPVGSDLGKPIPDAIKRIAAMPESKVIAQLDGMTAGELKLLLSLEEAAESPREAVIEAINEYDLGE